MNEYDDYLYGDFEDCPDIVDKAELEDIEDDDGKEGLRFLLEEYGLKTKGTKKTLRKRILEFCADVKGKKNLWDVFDVFMA